MVNGAQGDDDEAHAGHFALVTGRVQEDGAIGDWLVNNFYSLDVESEKGILAAPVPLDNYLADLNSGQGWYRPSCMLVAVFQRPRVGAAAVRAHRVYNQFWRHQLVYYHPTTNCTSISVDDCARSAWTFRRAARQADWPGSGFPFVARGSVTGGEARLRLSAPRPVAAAARGCVRAARRELARAGGALAG